MTWYIYFSHHFHQVQGRYRQSNYDTRLKSANNKMRRKCLTNLSVCIFFILLILCMIRSCFFFFFFIHSKCFAQPSETAITSKSFVILIKCLRNSIRILNHFIIHFIRCFANLFYDSIRWIQCSISRVNL